MAIDESSGITKRREDILVNARSKLDIIDLSLIHLS